SVEESPSKHLAKEIEKDPSNPFVAFGLPSKNDSDEPYCSSSDESSDDYYLELNEKEYIYEWFTGQGVKESTLSDGANKEMIELESLKIIFENIRNEFIPYQLSNNDIVRYYTIAKTANQNFQNCKPLLRKWQK
ncbi:5678_t:CDS:2, partial [Funneliformis mosseae]